MKLFLTIAVSLAAHAALLALPYDGEREPAPPAEALEVRTMVFQTQARAVHRPSLSPMPRPGAVEPLPEQHPLPEMKELTVDQPRFVLPDRLKKRDPLVRQPLNATLADLPQKLPLSPPPSQPVRAQTGDPQGDSLAEPPAGRATDQGPVERDFGGLDGPAFDNRVLPEYPPAARRTGKEGTVVLSLAIDARGVLTRATVLQSAGSDLDRAALRAVRASTFTPARRSGRAVASTATLPIRFELRGP
ncbi:MAG: energy transducer TonB [Desulfovibrionales bacterium]